MRFIASGVPYRNYQYRVARPQLRRGLMGLGVIKSVADAQADFNAAEKAFADATRVNPAVFRGYETPLEWRDLPLLKIESFDPYDMRVRVFDYLGTQDPATLRDIVANPSWSDYDRMAAWIILRVLLRPQSGISWNDLNGAIRASARTKEQFYTGAAWTGVDGETPAELAERAITIPGASGWADRLGVALRRAVLWANKFGFPTRRNEVSAAGTALKYAQADLELAKQAAAGATSGGSTEADVLELRRKQEEAEKKAKEEADRAKMYLMLGAVGVVAVGGFFWWKSRNR